MEGKVEWVALPAKDRKKLIIFIVTLGAFLSFVYYAAGFYWFIFSLVTLLLSLSPFYTPTRYTVDKRGVIIKRPLYTRKMDWRKVKRLIIDKNGVFLSPFSAPTRLENFRGVYLIIGGNEEIKRRIKELYEQSKRENKETEGKD